MKIAFIAMGEIRACDEELLRLGLTLPGFVERSKTIASLPSLGLLTLAALTPSKHEVAYIEIPAMAEIDQIPKSFDLVAISSYSAQISETYELADGFRQLVVKLYGDEFTNWRRRNFRQQFRQQKRKGYKARKTCQKQKMRDIKQYEDIIIS